jgi:hypothetical protein
MTNRGLSIARGLSALLEDLRDLRAREPDEAEAIRCALVAELVAWSAGAATLTETIATSRSVVSTTDHQPAHQRRTSGSPAGAGPVTANVTRRHAASQPVTGGHTRSHAVTRGHGG